MMVLISSLRLDGGTQIREYLDEQAVLDYTAILTEGEDGQPEPQMDPVIAFQDGNDPDLWLADGFHRVQAYLNAGRTEIPVEIRPGTLRDAILCAVGCNEKHGVKRTDEDKERAVRIILADAEWQNRASRWIARTCVVSHTFVQKIKSIGVDSNAQAKPRVKCSDGRTYERKKGKKGVGPKKRWVLCAMCAKGVKPKVVPCPTCERINNPKGYADTVVPGGERYDWDEFETAYGVLALFHPKLLRCYGKLVDQKVYEDARRALVAFLDSMQKLQKICTGRLNNTTARTQKT